MTLEAGKEMDRCCVLGWLNEVYRHPTVAFNTYSDEQQIEFAHDALVLLKEQEEEIENLKQVAQSMMEGVSLLKEQEAKEQISDAIHETAKQFRQTIVRCKDCDNRECDGRAGTIVCGITGFSHSRLWFCADGERRRK